MRNNNDTDKYYDNLINVALINLYTLSNKNDKKRVVLKNFKKNNKSHLCLLQIGSYSRMFGVDLYIKTNPINGFIIKKKTKLYFKTTKSDDGAVDCNEFIEYIEKANSDPGVFDKIWEHYFMKG